MELAIFIAITVVWLGILTYLFFRMKKRFDRLAGGADNETLSAVLDRLLLSSDETKKAIVRIDETLSTLSSDGESHFQKLGIVRFNPFADTGGSQSFTMAFLDALNTGFVMTSLYARTGNRWYIKQVKAGIGDAVPLSKEEQLAVDSAKQRRVS
jgi:hypothetical protein